MTENRDPNDTSNGAAASSHGFATRAIHAGQPPDPVTGAVVTPISLATTFAQPEVGHLPGGFEYGRTGNPTRAAYEACLADLEGGTGVRIGPVRRGRPTAACAHRVTRGAG